VLGTPNSSARAFNLLKFALKPEEVGAIDLLDAKDVEICSIRSSQLHLTAGMWSRID